MVHDPLTKLCCCPTSDGAGAAILCSEDFMKKHDLQDQGVEILGMTMTTDFEDTFDSVAGLCGYTLSKMAAQKVYEQSGFGPEDVDVVELHDCFATNELLSYEALGLCPEGKGGEFVDSEANTYGGKIVVNPSGGLISKGHPLGATGLAQCAEMVWQLRGLSEKRQVEGAKIAMSHNIGLGGACVVTMYRKATPLL
jgi:acetyl-CoA acetyltransferase